MTFDLITKQSLVNGEKMNRATTTNKQTNKHDKVLSKIHFHKNNSNNNEWDEKSAQDAWFKN